MSSEMQMKHPLGETTRSHHVAISVADIEATTRWYEEKLGCEVTGVWDPPHLPAKVRFLTVNGFTFEMVEVAGSKPSDRQGGDPPSMASVHGPIHMAFTVDDCAASAAELKRRGVKFSWDVQDYPELKVRCAHFYDLDGNMLELVEELD